MSIPLRLLVIDDNDDDALLVVRALEKGGYQLCWERVDSAAALVEALARQQWDAVTCDWVMDNFGALEALKLLRGRGVDAPIVLVSGQVGDEWAVTAMRGGPDDFVSKHNLSRLCPAIDRGLREAADRRARAGVEAQLRASEAKYQALVEQIPAITYTMGLTDPWRLLYVSPQVEQLVGVPPAAWTSESGWLEQVHPDDRDRIMQAFAGCFDRREPFVLEYRLLTPGGDVRWFRDQSTLVRDGNGRPLFLQGVMLDITDRRRVEEALGVSEERFRLIAETIDEVFWMADPDIGRLFYISRAYEDVWGRTRESLYAEPRSFLDAIHPEDRGPVLADLEMQKRGRPFAHEYRIVRPDGSVRWIWDRGFPVRDAAGHVTYYVGIAHDITERTQANALLQEREQQLRMITENMFDLVTRVSVQGIHEYVSPAHQRVLGYAAEEMLGKSTFSFIHPDDLEAAGAAIIAARASGQLSRLELRYRHADGHYVWLETVGKLVRDASGAPAGAVLSGRDITGRRAAASALVERAKLATLSADVGRALTEADALPTMLSRCAEAMVRQLDAAVVRIWTLNRADAALELQTTAGPDAHLDDLHSRIPIGHRDIGAIAARREPCVTNQVAGDPRITDQAWVGHTGMRAFAGYPLLIDQRLVGVMALFARHELSEFATTTLAAVASEIALGIQRKLTEEAMRALNDDLEYRIRERTVQLTAANRELEAFSYSVSHDLRAPLRRIEGFSQALVEEYGSTFGDTARGYLERVRAATAQMSELIDALLSLARVAQGELCQTAVDLGALATQILAGLHERDPHRTVDVHVAENVIAEGDAHLLRIVLSNLLGNAWKYSQKRPRARIEFGVTDHDGARAYFVRDNGVGFDMAYADRLFGAFQRLHSAMEFEGTGIGLATVQRIVRRHGGRIWAEAAVERGATFCFTLNSCALEASATVRGNGGSRRQHRARPDRPAGSIV